MPSDETPDIEISSEFTPVATNPVTGHLILRFGQLEPIEIPPDVAIKYAALLLRHAGCVVKVGASSLIARWTKKSLEPKRLPTEETSRVH